MDNNNTNDEIEIDLWEVCKNLLEHWKFILLIFAFSVLLAVSVTAFLIPKQYESRISMYVNNNKSSDAGYINSSDITASRNLVSTYIELIKSDSVLEKVIKKTDLQKFGIEELSTNSLRKMLECKQVQNTEIFEVRVRSRDPELSAELAENIGEVAPPEISRVFKSGSVEIIDRAKVPNRHVSPSVTKNAVLGGLLGIIISCGIIVVAGLLNQKIKSPKDFENKYDIPLLGIIPDRIDD